MSGRSASGKDGVLANVALTAIAAVFLNSYVARVALMPVYWFPAIALAGIVGLYLAKMRLAISS
jgi:hypothetical protein